MLLLNQLKINDCISREYVFHDKVVIKRKFAAAAGLNCVLALNCISIANLASF